jgi:hypothetical protein
MCGNGGPPRPRRADTAIAGAAGDAYTLTAEDLGQYLTVTVSRAGYTGTVTSPATAKVASADAAGPALTGSVFISGFPKVGGRVAANTSGLEGTGAIGYVWKRGAAASQADTAIAGAAGDAYTLTAEDLGQYLTVTVSRAGYTGAVTSPATAKVASQSAAEPVVSGVAVSPATATVEKGGVITFTAGVTGTGVYDDPAYQAVIWTIETGGVSLGTWIDQNGVLTVGANETQTSLTVRAASALNPEKSGAAAVTVTAASQPAEKPVPDTVRYNRIDEYLSAMPQNTAANPYAVKVEPVNISAGGVMGAIASGVCRYIILDLSACSASSNTISGRASIVGPPKKDDMNVIKANQYIVGVILPDSLTAIGNDAFDECKWLTSITIPAGVTRIGNDAFDGCGGLASVTIPDSVTSIGYYVFQECSGLTSITIPAGVTSIGEGAFYKCSGLTSITIPAGVTSIGEYAFYECVGLAWVTFDGSISSWNFSIYGTFPGSLRSRYFAAGGGPGIYTRSGDGVTWTKL